MRRLVGTLLIALLVLSSGAPPIVGQQRIQFPQTLSGLRPIDPSQGAGISSGQPAMIPLNGATLQGIYPSTGLGSQAFDPYGSASQSASQPVLPIPGYSGGGPPIGGAVLGSPYGAGAYGAPQSQGIAPFGGSVQPGLPGAGLSGSIGAYSGAASSVYPSNVYPNSTPPALFPNGYLSGGGGLGSLFGNWFGGATGGAGNWGASAPGGYAGTGGVYGAPGSIAVPNLGAWNPPGTMFSGNGTYPGFIRLFQGPRFRHAWISGTDDTDALQINDSDISLAFAIPNFLFSTQPLYLLPSFSLHNWDGPSVPAGADLPPLAYSAFLDAGWQSDSTRILGAELGLRVGMFTDFNTATSESLRIMGRGLGRIRLTPAAMIKLGVIYYDRNNLKLLPAGGLLWQPNPVTRFDLFFPEPKLAHYLTTVGNFDSWWYVGGYYGGGAWTIERASGDTDSVDINDIRLLLGIEWGRNEQMREGRRVGFFEVGYVFKRELEFKYNPLDNLDLQDSIVLRAGFGY